MLYFLLAVIAALVVVVAALARDIRALLGEIDLLVASLDGAHEEIFRLRAGVAVEAEREVARLRRFLLDHALVQRPRAKWFARVSSVTRTGVTLQYDGRVEGDDFVSL